MLRYESLLRMSSKKYKNIYINGCSFTAGDNVPEGLTWPELLSKKLNLNLINQSVNGNSMQTIAFNSVNHLSELNSEDTLVVIGFTWSPRYMVQFGNFTANVTPAIIGRKEYSVSFSTFRRVSSPYTTSKRVINDYHSKINKKNFNNIIFSFKRFYQSLIKYDTNLKQNQDLNLLTNIIFLQSFLKQNNFHYKFVNFGSLESDCDFPMVNKLDKENIISFDKSWKDEFVDGTSHPTIEGCENISEVIYDIINK